MYKSTQLKNGVRVLTVPMPDRDSVSLGVWVKVGGRYEPAKISGVSHFIEHLVFKGTKNHSLHEVKEKIEGKGGMLNAFTSEESTCYYAKTLGEHFPLALDILSELVLMPLLRPEDMAKERTVILEEIKMYLDIPSSHVQELMSEELWENQPLGRNLAGSYKSVSEMKPSELADFHRRNYHPTNVLVTASGKVSHTRLVEQVEKKFRRFKASEPSRFLAADCRQDRPKVRFLEKPTEQCHWVVGLHGLNKTHPDRYKLGLLHIILGANMSSRLFNEVREKRGLAYSIHTSTAAFLDAGSFSVSAGVDPKKAGLAIRITLQELKKVASKGVTAQELRRAKDYFLGQMLLMLEDTLDHMLFAGDRYLHLNNWLTRAEIKREVEKVTCSDLQSLAKTIFLSSHLNLALIGPLDTKAQKEIERFFSFENC